MVTDKYEKILKRFEMRYPHFYNKAIDWWATGKISIAIKLSDGTVLDYNDHDNTIRCITTNNEVDEETRTQAFGCNLQKFVDHCGMSKGEIAEQLGITKAMFSRYLHGKTMPSALKAVRLAEIMKCRVEEFFDENYMD